LCTILCVFPNKVLACDKFNFFIIFNVELFPFLFYSLFLLTSWSTLFSDSIQVDVYIWSYKYYLDLMIIFFFFFRANGISHKVERNVLNVSFQVNQYRSVIADLRNEISRLRTKLDEGRSKSSSGLHSDTPVNQIRDQIVSTFREQMKLRYYKCE